ncbi:MAG TPA: hypothetical protein P5109_09265, partial [Thermotogota bacterium]|nr:hypothetical protein [Thermotogota bacterium]
MADKGALEKLNHLLGLVAEINGKKLSVDVDSNSINQMESALTGVSNTLDSEIANTNAAAQQLVEDIKTAVSEALAEINVGAGDIQSAVQNIDFSALKTSAEDVAVNLYDTFRDAGYSAAEAVEELNNIGFGGLMENAEIAAAVVEETIGALGDKVVSDFGIAMNALDFATVDDKVKSLANSIMSTLSDLGVSVPDALDKITQIDFSPLATSA